MTTIAQLRADIATHRRQTLAEALAGDCGCAGVPELRCVVCTAVWPCRAFDQLQAQLRELEGAT